MKKYGKLLLVIFVLAQILLSCKTPSINIVKRHYRSGYYACFNSNKNEDKQIVNSLHEDKDVIVAKAIETADSKEFSDISDKNTYLNLSAPFSNEVTPVKNILGFSIITALKYFPLKNNSFTLLNNDHKSWQGFKQRTRNNYAIDSPPHNTGMILKVIGIIVASIGVLIFLSAFPAAEAGMMVGRLLLLIGILIWTVGAFM